MRETTRFAVGVVAGLVGVIALFAEKELSPLFFPTFALSSVLTAARPARDPAANQNRAVTIIIAVLLAIVGAALLLLWLQPSVLDSVQRWLSSISRVVPIWVKVLLAAMWLGMIVFRFIRFERERTQTAA